MPLVPSALNRRRATENMAGAGARAQGGVDERQGVRVRSADELGRILRDASAAGLRVTTASSGPGDVRLDLSGFDETTVSSSTWSVRVGAGVTWERLIARTAPHRMAVLPGDDLGRAVVEHTLAGAVGPVARTFGLAADHVLSIDLVTPAGDARTVTPTSDAGLFRALCGGASGLGVVTALTVGTVALQSVRSGTWWFAPAPVDDVAAVVQRWRAWVADLPESTSTRVLLTRTGQGVVLGLRFAHVGDLDEGAALLAELADDVPAPERNTVVTLHHPGVSGRLREPAPTAARARGGLFDTLPSAAVDAVAAAVAAAAPGTSVEVRLRGGAIARTPPVGGCVPGRRAAFSLRALAATQAEADAVADALAPWTTGGTTLDLGDPHDARAARALRVAWGDATHERITRLRGELDPAGVLVASWEPTQD